MDRLLPFVSIIITNFNGKKYLNDCFKSLEDLNYPKDRFEVILVDNASTDGSVEYAKKYFKWIKVIVLDKNYGFCKANNIGVKDAKGEYIVLLNNDTKVEKEWLNELVKGASIDDKIACCASKILYFDRKEIINSAGGKFTPVGGGFYLGYGDHDKQEYNNQQYTGFGCGAGVLVKKSFYNFIGGLDEDYFASIEEVELGLKTWLFGYRVLYVPTAIMYHKESGTFGVKGSFQPIKVYLITRNRLMNIVKNFELYNVLLGLIISILFDSYRAFKYLFNNRKSFASVFKAYIDFIKNLKKLKKKRYFTKKHRKLHDRDLYRLGVMATFKECVIEEIRLNKLIKNGY